jgi:hypothetical protein
MPIYNNHEKAGHAAAAAGDWNKALEHFRALPERFDIYSQLPSAYQLPDHVAHQILDKRPNDPNFLYELAHNLPPTASAPLLQRIHKLGDNDHIVRTNVEAHPNWVRSPEDQNLEKAAKFWLGYELKVHPSHFAAVKSTMTGKPETIKTHRGEIGKSSDLAAAIPHLNNYANKIQEQILADPDIKKRMHKGEPHVKLYRGVGGNYGQKIHEAAEYSHDTKEAKKKTFTVPAAPFSSWTTDPHIASRFAWGRGGGIIGPNDKGVVMSAWVPVKNILHSSSHNAHSGQEHREQMTPESEIIVKHPTGKMKISTAGMQFQAKPDDIAHTDQPHSSTKYGEMVKPTLKHEVWELEYEILEKGLKSKAAAIATALTMAGAPALYQPSQSAAPTVTPIQAELPKTTATPSVKKPTKASDINPQLRSIAAIESNHGKYTDHPMVEAGLNAGTKAIGAHGLMPLTITEVIKKNPTIRGKHPELSKYHYINDHDKIHQYMKDHPEAYKEIVNSHWKRLTDRFDGDLPRMVYAWRNGITASMRASDTEIAGHPYVKKYFSHEKMSALDKPAADIKKAMDYENKITRDLGKFTPLIHDDRSKQVSSLVNYFIEHGDVHDLSDHGHFTHNSFVVGTGAEDAWLVKVDQDIRPAIQAAKYGSPAIKEYLYYILAKDSFKMGDYVPEVVIGRIKLNGKERFAAAIKVLPDDYKTMVSREKTSPGSMSHVMEKMRKTGELHKIAAMEYILGNADAHGGNYMTDGKRVVSIDHGTSFADDTFAPGSDDDSFIPYILRVNRVRSGMSSEDIAQKLPKIDDPEALNSLKYWLFHINFDGLQPLLNTLSMDIGSSTKRLHKIQEQITEGARPDEVINKAWLE